MTRDYHQFREWAEALAAEDAVNHQGMLEYADAWEVDHEWAKIGPEMLKAARQAHFVLSALDKELFKSGAIKSLDICLSKVNAIDD